jgi:hypothetical protein
MRITPKPGTPVIPRHLPTMLIEYKDIKDTETNTDTNQRALKLTLQPSKFDQNTKISTGNPLNALSTSKQFFH